MTPTTGRWIAFAAVLVQAPRLILALLAADREPVGLEWQRGLLVVAGLGTAVVLTGTSTWPMRSRRHGAGDPCWRASGWLSWPRREPS